MIKPIICVVALLTSFATTAQQAGSDIWLGKLNGHGNEKATIQITEWTQITDEPLYHNQPYFSEDSKSLYYTAASTSGQTDLFQFELKSQKHSNLTQSDTSEYSPTPMPNAKGISGIWVDEAGKQWLQQWSFTGERQSTLLTVEPIGYHVWVSPDEVLVFVLGEGEQPVHTLQRHDVTDGAAAKMIDQHIGASLWAIPQSSGKFSYSKRVEGQHWLMAYHSDTDQVEQLVKLPEDTDYYTWTPNGIAVIGSQEPKLLAWSPELGVDWVDFVTAPSECKRGISRLSFSDDGQYLAIVCNR